MIDPHFVIVGAILSFMGGLSYLRDTIRGKAQPNRITWFLWALAPMIAFAAQLSEQVGMQALLTFMVGFNPLLIFIASFIGRNAQWKLTKFDICCAALSLAGIVLWQASNDAALAVGFSIAADLAAGLPTLIKAFKWPETENYKVFLGGAISAALTLLTLTHWSFIAAAFAVYILLICLVLIALIRFQLGRRLLKMMSTLPPSAA